MDMPPISAPDALRCPIDPRTIKIKPSSDHVTSSCASAAIYWHSFGFNVIPIIPGTKRTAVKWNPWREGLSPEKIKAHWDKHPDHEVGFIVGDDVIVFDADSPQSIAAIAMLEEVFDITPNLTVTTTRGRHHYYRLAAGTYAKTDSHGTEEHPERIDVKTGRTLVVLTPSTVKEVDTDGV